MNVRGFFNPKVYLNYGTPLRNSPAAPSIERDLKKLGKDFCGILGITDFESIESNSNCTVFLFSNLKSANVFINKLNSCYTDYIIKLREGPLTIFACSILLT